MTLLRPPLPRPMPAGRPPRSSARLRRRLALALVLAAGLLLLADQLHRAYRPVTTPSSARGTVLAPTFDLHDLGVADVDDDGFFDIFSVNHSNRQLLLVRQADGSYRDQLLELGLSQSHEFPGVEDNHRLPAIEAPGLYIYWESATLVLRASTFGAAGRIELPRELKLTVSDGASVSPAGDYNQRFSLPPGGSVRLASWRYYFRPTLELDPEVPLDRVFVGPGLVNPTAPRFTLPEQDRHGMAWADYTGDGRTDLFIVRGGDEGRLAETDPAAGDELFVAQQGSFTRVRSDTGLVKHGLPGRGAQWVDVNGDGSLDLFVGNGRVVPPNHDAPNQVFLRVAAGAFQEAAARLGLDTPGQGRSLWLDLGHDGQMDLLWADATSLRLYRRTGDTFAASPVAPLWAEPNQLTAADFDEDGDADVFVASKAGNLLLVNQGTSFDARDPVAFGLPAESFAATWVDVDNDGALELHLLPQGLFRRESGGRFAATGQFALRSSALLASRRILCTWFDADNNGTRDLLITLPDPLSSVRASLSERVDPNPVFHPRRWNLHLYSVAPVARHHWLQVALVGPPGNRPAIGARVEVQTASRRHVREIGHAEGALHSQGHYRAYFGLGTERRVARVIITWPDGVRQALANPASDQLLVVRRQP